MASSMAAAAAHSMPPFPLPAISRVRPPPIPKGTPGPNTLPQPGRPPKDNLVWADGRWKSPSSRSAKHKQEIISKQLEKALQHEVHGMNIYAYKHIRTQQVVYSLTKNMDNTKILKQLLYHGKKTVPAALRRDVWRPYFSVHFPRTPAGSSKGLRVFQELRELSALRQLKPPMEMTLTTQKDIDDLKRGFDPVEWLDKTEKEIAGKDLMKIPVVGERLPPKLLAKRLMNQAATSVADIAAILTRQTNIRAWNVAQLEKKQEEIVVEPAAPTPQQHRDRILQKRKAKEKVLSIRANDRLSEIRKRMEVKAEQLEQRQQYLAEPLGQARIDQHTRDRINIEYEGVGRKLTLIEEADQSTREEIGATVALERALENMEEEKQVQRQDTETRMGAEIEQRLSKLTEAERDEIEKEVEAERAQKQSEIDAQLAATREKYKEQRARLYEQPPSHGRTLALRKLSRDSQTEVLKMRADLRTRHLKWAGPFASIATAVHEEMAAIDAKWKPILVELRQQVRAERRRYADLNNHEVEIRWANIRDGTYAKSWPDSVYHADLQPKAVTKQQLSAVTTHFHYDADEEAIETQVGLVEIPRRSTVHVFGSLSLDPESNGGVSGRYESASELTTKRLSSRAMRVQEWTNTEAIIVRDRIVAMRSQRDELERDFAGTEVDGDNTPWIHSSMGHVEVGREILEKMQDGSFGGRDLKALDDALQIIRENDAYCRDEIDNSENQFADEARVKYAMLMADLMALESRNQEARQQAEIRHNFIREFNQREKLERDIEMLKSNEEQQSIAIRNLAEFDAETPMVRSVLARRAALLENLPSEIEESEAEIDRLESELSLARTSTTGEAEQSQSIESLEQELKSERQRLQAKTAELEKLELENAGGQEAIWKVIRDDKQAWLEFKRDKMMAAYTSFDASTSGVPETDNQESKTVKPVSDAVAGDQGMVMSQPEDTKGGVGKAKGRLEKGARLLGLGRFFDR